MAPKRKRGSEVDEPSTPNTTRVTRSAARAALRSTRSGTILGGAPIVNADFSDPEPRRRKMPRTSAAGSSSSLAAAASSLAATGASSSSAGKAVIIEHSVQCDSFKNKASQVKKGLEKAVSGLNVLVNPGNPRNGCFEIREEGGDIFVSLLDLQSPFEPMKALNVRKVVSDIVDRIK